MPEMEIVQGQFSKSVFNTISSEMRKRGYKQKELALEFNVSESEYSRALHGNQTPKARKLRKLTYEKLGME